MKKRSVAAVFKSKVSIRQYYQVLAGLSIIFAVVIFVVYTWTLGKPISQMSNVEIFQSFWLSMFFVFLAGVFLYSGKSVVEQLETERLLIIDQIERMKSGDYSDKRSLRDKDELREIMAKLHELSDHMDKEKS